MKPTIVDTGRKFVIHYNGEESYLAYRQRGEVLDFYSTYVPQPLKGKGMASDLILYGIHYAVMNGLRVKATCPAVSRFLEINREWQYLTVYSLN